MSVTDTVPKSTRGGATRSTRSQKLKAALAYAERGWPVFPCEARGKRPLTPRGFKDATTDPARITAWLNSYPDANIAIVTGSRSGIWALDVDPDNGGFDTLSQLEEEHGALPATRTHRTPSGGVHYILTYPGGPGEKIGNSVGKLGPGLDIRAEGGYIVAPPSYTNAAYMVLDDRPPTDPTEWLLRALREDSRGPGGQGGEASPMTSHKARAVSVEVDGPAIPEGERNDTLARIAGKIHDGTLSLDELTAVLLEINESRCRPGPLPCGEVRKIAESIYRYPPREKGRPVVSGETLRAVEVLESDLWRRDWPGVGGKSERDVCAQILAKTRECGRLVPAGTWVSMSYAELALRSGVSKRALMGYRKNGEHRPGIIERLSRKGILRRDNAGRSATEAGAFVMVFPVESRRFHHTASATDCLRTTEIACGETFATVPRLRHSERDIRRLGKGRGHVIDALVRSGGELTLGELTAALNPERGTSKHRSYYLRHSVLPPLQRAGVVEVEGESVRLALDYREALERARVRGGEIAAETRDRERHRRQSAEHRMKLAAPEGKRDEIRIPPTELELEACRDLEEIRRSGRDRWRARKERERLREMLNQERESGPKTDGEVRELEPLGDNPLVAALAQYLHLNPHRAKEPPSWLAVAVWAYMSISPKPTPDDVRGALAELAELGEGVAA